MHTPTIINYVPSCWGYSIDHEIDSLCGSELYSLTQYMHELCNYVCKRGREREGGRGREGEREREGGREGERERERRREGGRERNGAVISDC